MISSNEEVYEGMVVGLHSRENDLPVNPMKAKQLTNIRAAGTDENISLTEPLKLTVESALEFIEETVPQWFIMHLNTMDKVTAQFLYQRKGNVA